MKKKLIIIITAAIALVAAIVGVVIFFFGEKLELPKLTADDISRIYYDAADDIDLDIEEFLRYYNGIYDIRDEVEGQIGTPPGRIVIELKNGETIRLSYNTIDQFEIDFRDSEGKYYQYWGRQEEIFNMLNHYGFD